MQHVWIVDFVLYAIPFALAKLPLPFPSCFGNSEKQVEQRIHIKYLDVFPVTLLLNQKRPKNQKTLTWKEKKKKKIFTIEKYVKGNFALS